MKKCFKYLLLIFSIFMVGTLSSCGESNNNNGNHNSNDIQSNDHITDNSENHNDEKVVPTYRGMDFKDSNKTLSLANHTSYNDDSDFEIQIEDMVELEGNSSVEASAYVKKGQDLILAVRLSNPSAFEIQSFTLNGQKYASYMFEKDSDIENLYLKVKAPEETGYHMFTLDAIKYIDGTQIKDIDLSTGEKAIIAGVEHDVAPFANVNNENLTATSYALDVDFHDEENIIDGSAVKFYVSDGKKIIKDDNLRRGINHININNLEPNKKYQYAVMSAFDLCDGKGNVERVITKNSFVTAHAFEINNLFTNRDSVSFELNKILDNATIDSIVLLDNFSEVKRLTDFSKLEFTGLLSNHNYRIRIDYNYTVNGVSKNASFMHNITTKEVIAPYLKIENIRSDKNSFSFNLNLKDNEGIFNLERIEVYKGRTFVKYLDKLSVITATDLLSDTEYTIKIEYSYNLNDGEGIQHKVLEEKIKTKAKDAPIVDIENVIPTTDSIKFDLNVNDPDSIYHLEMIELYKNGQLINSLKDFNNFEFTGLLANSEYTIRVTYSYDLGNNGNKKSITLEKSIMTLEKDAPKVEISNVVAKKDRIYFTLSKEDPNNICEFIKIDVYDGNMFIESLMNNGVGTYNFRAPLSNHLYTIKVFYRYDLKDTTGYHFSNKQYSIRSNSLVEPTVKIKDLVTTSDAILFDVDVIDVDYIANFEKFELFKGNLLIDTIYDIDYLEFDKLLSDTEYTIKATYSYDLNDGEALNYNTITVNTKTKAKDAPTVKVINTFGTVNSIDIGLSVFDKSEIYKLERFEVKVDGVLNKVIDHLMSMQGEQVYTINGLRADTNYTIDVIYSYDLNDGKGRQEASLEVNEKTIEKGAPMVKVSSYSNNPYMVGFNLNVDDKTSTYRLSKVELYDENNQLVAYAYGPLNSYEFNNLLSDHVYTIKVNYSYNLNDGKGRRETFAISKIKTEELKAPHIDFVNVNSTKDSINFSYFVKANQNVTYSLKSIGLYKDGKLCQSIDVNKGVDINNVEFKNVLSNVTYTIIITYKYDLHDGQGIKEISESYFVGTAPLKAPTITLYDVTTTYNSISFVTHMEDIDNICHIEKIELLEYGEVTKTVPVTENVEINGLLSQKEYEIKITYSYDLNDGYAKRTGSYSRFVTTK